MTIGDALPLELTRVREVLNVYRELGPPGAFGALMIEVALQRADQAMIHGDIVEMLTVYEELKTIE